MACEYTKLSCQQSLDLEVSTVESIKGSYKNICNLMKNICLLATYDFYMKQFFYWGSIWWNKPFFRFSNNVTVLTSKHNPWSYYLGKSEHLSLLIRFCRSWSECQEVKMWQIWLNQFCLWWDKLGGEELRTYLYGNFWRIELRNLWQW